MRLEIQDLLEKVRLFLKLPFTFVVATLGFLIEFLICAPFLVLCELDQRFRKS
jgi:hypothetical protein